MLPRTDTRSPLCPPAERFRETMELHVFSQISADTTLEQFKNALAYLSALKRDREENLPRFHFGTATGFHRCLSHVFEDAVTRLTLLSLLKVERPPEPAPPQPPQSPQDVLDLFLGSLPEGFFFWH